MTEEEDSMVQPLPLHAPLPIENILEIELTWDDITAIKGSDEEVDALDEEDVKVPPPKQVQKQTERRKSGKKRPCSRKTVWQLLKWKTVASQEAETLFLQNSTLYYDYMVALFTDSWGYDLPPKHDPEPNCDYKPRPINNFPSNKQEVEQAHHNQFKELLHYKLSNFAYNWWNKKRRTKSSEVTKQIMKTVAEVTMSVPCKLNDIQAYQKYHYTDLIKPFFETLLKDREASASKLKDQQMGLMSKFSKVKLEIDAYLKQNEWKGDAKSYLLMFAKFDKALALIANTLRMMLECGITIIAWGGHDTGELDVTSLVIPDAAVNISLHAYAGKEQIDELYSLFMGLSSTVFLATSEPSPSSTSTRPESAGAQPPSLPVSSSTSIILLQKQQPVSPQPVSKVDQAELHASSPSNSQIQTSAAHLQSNSPSIANLTVILQKADMGWQEHAIHFDAIMTPMDHSQIPSAPVNNSNAHSPFMITSWASQSRLSQPDHRLPLADLEDANISPHLYHPLPMPATPPVDLEKENQPNGKKKCKAR
ncbi:hypothetical protein Moror_9247 [Moniliophthora roreri MCA 2997]|uniref:Uncharacterized protein n=1 Tax=Moniliophthora roreri (strain MCA 2997) TaxID=1381753 RepID=V2WWL6_MONRO|nr:hypothetical protein Moror_9247 [Moniliophthora roreri MCA 2997]